MNIPDIFVARSRATVLLVTGVCLLPAIPVEARQFRSPVPIATPRQHAAQLPDGAKPVSTITPVTREQVEPAVRELLQSWNTAGLANKLAQQFTDSQRLLDTLHVQAPRDASLRLQSIQGVQTISQYLLQDSTTGGQNRVSIVSVTIRTQLEFNSPTAGFVRRAGLNEYILRITNRELP